MPELFVTAAYSSHLDPETGVIQPWYKKSTEEFLEGFEAHEFEVVSTLREHNYQLPLDNTKIGVQEFEVINHVDGLVERIEERSSRGSSRHVGGALLRKIPVFVVCTPMFELDHQAEDLIKEKRMHRLDASDIDYEKVHQIIAGKVKS